MISAHISEHALSVRGFTVAITGRCVLGNDTRDGGTASRDIIRGDEVEPVSSSGTPTAVHTETLIARRPISTPNVTEIARSRCHSVTAIGAFVVEERQRVGVINLVLLTQPVECLAQPLRRGLRVSQDLINETGRERRATTDIPLARKTIASTTGQEQQR